METSLLKKRASLYLAALVSFVSISPLLGPNPTGLIGMSGLLLGAIFLLTKLEGKQA